MEELKRLSLHHPVTRMSNLQMQFSIEDTSPPGRGELSKLNTLKNRGGFADQRTER